MRNSVRLDVLADYLSGICRVYCPITQARHAPRNVDLPTTPAGNTHWSQPPQPATPTGLNHLDKYRCTIVTVPGTHSPRSSRVAGPRHGLGAGGVLGADFGGLALGGGGGALGEDLPDLAMTLTVHGGPPGLPG